jgi:fucose permease
MSTRTTSSRPRTARSDARSPGGRRAAPLVVLMFLGFVSLGLPDGLLGVAWPSIRQSFGTSLDALGALFITFTIGYLVSSVSSGRVVARLGVGLLLAISSLLTGVALLGYAIAPAWWTLVLLGFVAGTGAGAIDAGLNVYAAAHYSRRFLNWLHASYGLGAALGPLIMMAVLSSGYSWRWGYASVALAQGLLGLCFLLTTNRWGMADVEQPPADPSGKTRSSLTMPIAWLGIILFFVYVGIEVSAGQWSYSLFTESRSVAPSAAGFWVSIYWASLSVGRLVFGFVANRVPISTLLRVTMLGVLCGAAMISLNASETLSFLGLGLMGLASAPIFPALISGTPSRVGQERSADVIGFQVGAASLGGALMPGLAGVLADRFSLEIVGPFLLVAAIAMVALHEAVATARRRTRL